MPILKQRSSHSDGFVHFTNHSVVRRRTEVGEKSDAHDEIPPTIHGDHLQFDGVRLGKRWERIKATTDQVKKF